MNSRDHIIFFLNKFKFLLTLETFVDFRVWSLDLKKTENCMICGYLPFGVLLCGIQGKYSK